MTDRRLKKVRKLATDGNLVAKNPKREKTSKKKKKKKKKEEEEEGRHCC
jgi:hypothetical protein